MREHTAVGRNCMTYAPTLPTFAAQLVATADQVLTSPRLMAQRKNCPTVFTLPEPCGW